MSIVDELELPETWEKIPLGYAFDRVRQIGGRDLPPLSVFLDAGVVPRSQRSDNRNELGEDLDKYLVVARGDLVFNKLRTWQGGFGVSRSEGIVSPAYFVCRPRPGVDARFIDYLLHSAPYLAELTRISKWQPPSQFDTPWEQLRRVQLLVPPVRLQEAIVERLDSKIAAIGDVAEKIASLRSTLPHVAGGVVASVFAGYGIELPNRLGSRHAWPGLPPGWHLVPLGRVLRQLTNGFVGPTRDLLVDEGVRYIQSTHIKDGRIDFERRPFFVPEAWHEQRPRIHLRSGDVLIVQTGKLGEVALVPEGFGHASCHALLIARADPRWTSGAWLSTWFRTPFGRETLLERATGALHPHLEAGEIRQIPVPIPPREVQAECVRRAQEAQYREDNAAAELEAAAASLAALRTATITELTTGIAARSVGFEDASALVTT